jgi:hypothetical protein
MNEDRVGRDFFEAVEELIRMHREEALNVMQDGDGEALDAARERSRIKCACIREMVFRLIEKFLPETASKRCLALQNGFHDQIEDAAWREGGR